MTNVRCVRCEHIIVIEGVKSCRAVPGAFIRDDNTPHPLCPYVQEERRQWFQKLKKGE